MCPLPPLLVWGRFEGTKPQSHHFPCLSRGYLLCIITDGETKKKRSKIASKNTALVIFLASSLTLPFFSYQVTVLSNVYCVHCTCTYMCTVLYLVRIATLTRYFCVSCSIYISSHSLTSAPIPSYPILSTIFSLFFLFLLIPLSSFWASSFSFLRVAWREEEEECSFFDFDFRIRGSLTMLQEKVGAACSGK